MKEKNDIFTNEFVYLILSVVALFSIGLLYNYFRVEFNTVFFSIGKYEIYPFAIMGFDKASAALQTISNADPAAYDFTAVKKIFTFVGFYTRWVVCFIIAILIYFTLTAGKAGKYTRKLNMEALLEENLKAYPTLAPVVGRKILEENPNSGPWRTALQPLQFAIENKLLVADNGKVVEHSEVMDNDHFPLPSSPYLKPNAPKLYIDRDKAEKVFIEQLGNKPEHPIYKNDKINPDFLDTLPDYIIGLIAVFVAQGSGSQGRVKALELNDQLSLTFQEEGRLITRKKLFYTEEVELAFDIDISGARELIEEYGGLETLLHATRFHTNYFSTWIVSLYLYARAKGLLPTSMFIWLKPTDRKLWYNLNQVGGNTAWCEAAGPWNHYHAEEALRRPLNQPMTLGAVDALEGGLREVGWLPKTPDMFVDEEN